MMRTFAASRSIIPFLWQTSIVLISGALISSLALALVDNVTIFQAVGVPVILFLFVALLVRPDIGILVVLVARASADAILVLGRGAVGGLHGTLGALTSPNAGFVLALVLCGGLFVLRRNVPFLSLPGGVLLTLLVMTGLPGMLRSDTKLLAVNEWLPLISVLVVYALSAYCCRNIKWIQRVIDALAISFVLPAIFGFTQLILHPPSLGIVGGEPTNRIYGTFVHSNPFGVYLVIMISIFVCQAFVHSGRRRALGLLIVSASIVLLGATLARFAWGGALIALFVIGVLRHRVLLVAVSIVVLLAMAAVPTIATRAADPLRSASFEDRVSIWNSTISYWVDQTQADGIFVTGLNRLAGLGPGTAEYMLGGGSGALLQPPHNDYVRILGEFGIFGLILYIALIFTLIRLAYRTWRQTAEGPMSAVVLSFLGLTIAYPFMSWTGNLFGATNNQIYFWTLAGLTAGISQRRSAGEQHLQRSVNTNGSPR